jgi:hypothetical protein
VDIELSKIIIPAVAGLIAGSIGSLIAPWVNWGIEKKKLIRKSREELIQHARDALIKEDLSNKEFSHLTIYSRIKPYLSEQAVKAVEGEYSRNGQNPTEVIRVVMGNSRDSGVNPFKNRVLDELAMLEKKWDLI